MSSPNFEGLASVGGYLLLLGLFIGTVLSSFTIAAPIVHHHHPLPSTKFLQHQSVATTTLARPASPRLQLQQQETSQPEDEFAGRGERSPIHVTGTARRIQMFIKNRHLQIMPDGVVNGTTDDTSIYTILQRTTVGIGQVKIQGVATCQYLCMASCGLLYSSKYFGDDCVFKETIEPSNYNTYCSRKYSTNEKRTFYLALNRRGQSRKVVVRSGSQLGKLASFARVLTRTIPEMQLHHLRQLQTCIQQVTDNIPKSKEYLRCPKKKSEKKPTRICSNGMHSFVLCKKKMEPSSHRNNFSKCQKDFKLCPEDSVNQIFNNTIGAKKQVLKRNKKLIDEFENNESTTSLVPTTTLDGIDDDYGIDPGAHTDWESTTTPNQD